MLDTLFSKLSLADTHDDLYRNIVSLRIAENLFDDLSDTPQDWQAAIDLELESKPAAFASPTPVIHRPFEEAIWNEAIGYPFRNWMRSRYSDGTFGIWYGADSVETTVYETVHHWRYGLLEDAGFLEPGIRIERKIYRVRCDAALVDLRNAVKKFAALIDPRDYTFTHQVGSRLHHEGHPGLVSRSARCTGDTYGVLNPDVLSGPQHNCYLTYITTPKGIAVERTPGRRWMTVGVE